MLAKNFPSKITIIELFITMSSFHDVHMSHSKVFGNYDSQKTEIKVKNYYTFRGKFMWQ